jgi:microcystin-dependent protein
MAPSAVNDGVRGAMAAVAKYRDDIAGAIVTGGTSTAYTLFSYQGFDSLAHMDGAMIAFAPHATNGATVTLNVDSLGAKPLRSGQGVELLAGTLIQTAPYVALYNNTDGAWYLHGFYGQAYNVPLLGSIDYFGTTAPNSSFIFPRGQALSRTTYAAAFAIMGTTHGSGDGSTTFNVPDLSGRVTAMIELSASRLTSTYFGGNSTLMGATGGADHTSNTIAKANLPAYNLDLSGTSVTVWARANTNISSATGPTTVLDQLTAGNPGTGSNAVYPISGNIPLGGIGTALAVGSLPPTITCNKILRII